MTEFAKTSTEELPSADAGLTTIVIHGGFDATACDNHAAAHDIRRCWERRQNEDFSAFRTRAENEAATLGAKVLIFGGFPNMTLDMEKKAIAHDK